MYGNQVNLGLGAMMMGSNGLGYVGDLRNSAAPSEPPTSPILHALAGCNDANSSLHDRISILESRLSMLLGQEITTGPANACMDKAPAPASELAGRLSDVSGNLWVAVARLENLTARLTL